MRKLFKNALIYSSQKKDFVVGDLLVNGKVIEDASKVSDGEVDEVIDLSGKYLAPGLVDLHTHGRAGFDFNTADTDGLVAMSSSYLERGVTALLPTLASAPFECLLDSADKIVGAIKGGAENFCGIHLEGRYLNPEMRGAHASELLAPLDSSEISALIEKMKRAGKVHISAALELDGDGEFLDTAKRLGATVGLGHTAATFDEAESAFCRGAISLTHTFNAMTPIHHRAGGAVTAGLINKDVFCELIADGVHISPEVVKLVYINKKEELVLITDSMEATGMSDGEYRIAGNTVSVVDGKALTHEGKIAGSTLDLIDAVKNLSRFADISFGEALYCATAAPAKMIGLYDTVGSLDTGKRADMIVLDNNFEITEVYLGGEKVSF